MPTMEDLCWLQITRQRNDSSTWGQITANPDIAGTGVRANSIISAPRTLLI